MPTIELNFLSSRKNPTDDELLTQLLYGQKVY